MSAPTTSPWVSQRATHCSTLDETLGDRVRADAWSFSPDAESWDEHQTDVSRFVAETPIPDLRGWAPGEIVEAFGS